jgi:hypothetical protein
VQSAASEDYGQDYEHLLVSVWANWQDLTFRILCLGLWIASIVSVLWKIFGDYDGLRMLLAWTNNMYRI